MSEIIESSSNPDALWACLPAVDAFDQVSTTGKKVKTRDCSESGTFPVIDQGQADVAGYVDDEEKVIQLEGPVVVFGDHTRAIKWVEHDFVPGADGTKVLKALPFMWPRFAYYQLRSLEIPDKGYSRHFKFLRELSFYVPSMAEQKAIAEKLDTLLAQVENTKARLERIPQILKRFRQSVLAAAVSGKLTATDGYADEWVEKPLEEVASNIVDCPHSTPRWSDVGKYCVRTTAFNPFYLDLSEQGFVSDEVFEERIQRLRPEGGDILYSREGTVGIACQVPLDVELCLGQRMVLIRAGNAVLPKFLTIVLNSEKILSVVREKTMGSTAPRVNMKDIRAYRIPIPRIDEQTEVVRRVGLLFEYANNIELKVAGALGRVELLTQSVLAKAFRGELTDQWRRKHAELVTGENGAEALLAKIQADKAAAARAKRGRRKTG